MHCKLPIRACVCLVALLIPSSKPASAAKEAETSPKSPGLAALDLDGKRTWIGGREGDKIAVVVFLSTGCPVSNTYLPRLQEIADGFASKDVQILGVFSDSSISRAEAVAHRKKYDLRFTLLFDAGGEVRSRLRPTHVPQAIVLGKDGKTVYSGLIDDLYAELGRKRNKVRHNYLVNAVNAALRNQEPSVRKTTPIGCLVEDVDRKLKPGRVNYSRHIAPIIQAHCVNCHRPGESAPFSLLKYEDVARRARQIATVTKSRFMPPWKPVPGYGEFRDERRLSNQEIELIEAWVEGGKPQGDPAELPPPPKFVKGWQLGTPDLVLTMTEAYELRAHGPDDYRYFVVPVPTKAPRLVSAMEFRPGNPNVAHHATVCFDNSGTARRLAAQSKVYGYGGLGGPGFLPSASLGNWLPGSTPIRLPEGSGQYMPGGADLVLQMHYQCTGKKEFDRSSVGIHFAKRGAGKLVNEFQVLNSDLNIPPGSSRHHHVARLTMPTDLTLLDLSPHLHLLGREIKVYAELPSGKKQPFIWIKDWDFNWQGQYEFAQPVRVKKGTTIVVETWFDNSSKNPLNPHSPPRRVGWGNETNNEMPLCHFRYTADHLGHMRIMARHYLDYMRKNFPNDESVQTNGKLLVR